jgi:XTP/dITP diphosphohydrolase
LDKKIFIATNNTGKQREISELLKDLSAELVFPESVGINIKVEENAETYAGNALLKARAFSRASQMLSLADDSGLEVDVLGGFPGLHSARISPRPGASDADRRALLLELLADFPPPWIARFRCVVALVSPAGIEHISEGVCPGEIISRERGENGFGYDPVFLLPEYQRTMAELSLQEKNRVSHRARAVTAARPAIIQILEKM